MSIAKRYMTKEMKETEIKFLKNEKRSLLVDLEAETGKYEAMVHRIASNKREILKIKEDTLTSPEYMAEEEGKNRVSYLREIINDATRDVRYENDELIDLKRAKELRLFIIKEKISMIKEEIYFLNI